MSSEDRQQKRLAILRKAKQALADEFGKCEWFRGAGIARRGDEWILRLNVDPSVEGEIEPPAEFEGIPIDIVHIGVYRKRGPSRRPRTGGVGLAEKTSGAGRKKSD